MWFGFDIYVDDFILSLASGLLYTTLSKYPLQSSSKINWLMVTLLPALCIHAGDTIPPNTNDHPHNKRHFIILQFIIAY